MPRQDESIESRGIVSNVSVREISEESRTITYIAATENGVETWAGLEYLNMDGVDLKRYKKNPVVLDSHNRYGLAAIIGEATITIENRQLIAAIRFAETEPAEEAWKLAKGGFLKSVSVGYRVRKAKVLAENEIFKMGEREIKGPARVAEKWELLETSLVPVGADPDALKRGFGEGMNLHEILSNLARAIGCDVIKHKEPNMAGEKPNETAEQNDTKPAVTAQETRAAEPTALELLNRNVSAICPKGLEVIADRCILEGKTLEETRAVLLAEHAKGMKPVGTTDEKEPEKTAAKTEERAIDEVTDEELMRAL